MVNVTGNGVRAPEYQRTKRNVSAVIPRVNFSEVSDRSPASGQSAQAISRLVQGVSGSLNDRLDIQAETEAIEEGRRAGRNGAPQLRDETTIKGRAYNRAARDSARTDFDLRARIRLDELESEFSGDAVGFQEKSEAYIRGHVEGLYEQGLSEIAQDIEAKFLLGQRNALKRIEGRQVAAARDQQLEVALRSQIKLQGDVQNLAGELFSADPESVPNILAQLVDASGEMTGLSSQVGADGQPLFGARQRVAMEQNASEALGGAIGMAYLQSQDDLFAGYEAFAKGGAFIEAIDSEGQVQKVNLNDFLGADVKAQVRKTYMQNLKSELSLRNQMDAANERAFKESSDVLYSDLVTASQDGRLTLSIVDAAKSSLEPDRYVALREMAKGGGATVSDGAVLSYLSVSNADGVDVRDAAVVAFREGKLELNDFTRIYEDNSARLNKGVRDPVQTGRDYLTKGLGALSSEIGLAQSSAIGGATAEYEIKITQFVEENARQPSAIEARDIAEDIRSRYSVLSVEDSLIALPLPRSLTQAEKLSRDLTAASIADKVKQVNQMFLDKHNGNAEQRNADPEYLNEMQLLEQYFDLLEAKEKNRAR